MSKRVRWSLIGGLALVLIVVAAGAERYLTRVDRQWRSEESAKLDQRHAQALDLLEKGEVAPAIAALEAVVAADEAEPRLEPAVGSPGTELEFAL